MLPVVATALTLGALLVNAMAGGSVTAWVLTGVSALVCAGAWALYYLHHKASRPRRGGRRAASAPVDPYPGERDPFDSRESDRDATGTDYR